MDYSKCSLCKEKDITENMIMPCKCNQWVHKSCLNKKRIADPTYFDECPVCKSKYCLEKKIIPEWKKIAEIVFSVVIDLLLFVSAFTAGASILGWIIAKCGITFSWTNKPFLIGATVLMGVLGFIAMIYGMLRIFRDNVIMLHNIDFRGDNALIMFVVIGCVVLLFGIAYWLYVTLKYRIERHKRAVGVKEFEVKDFTRGIVI